jgi:hypothetical protein
MPNNVWAAPCFSSGRLSSRVAWLDGWNPPAASPWITRNRISCGRLAAMPHSTEATVKTAIDQRK